MWGLNTEHVNIAANFNPLRTLVWLKTKQNKIKACACFMKRMVTYVLWAALIREEHWTEFLFNGKIMRYVF